MKQILLFTSFFITLSLVAQDLIISWDNSYGGPQSEQIHGAILETYDGGFFAAGYGKPESGGDRSQEPIGRVDAWVVKTDCEGNIEWESAFGGDASCQINIYSTIQTTDSGYIIVGKANSGIGPHKSEAARGGDDFWMMKMNKNGNYEWDKTYGGSGMDICYQIVKSLDGYYLVGYSNSDVGFEKSENSFGEVDYWVVKVDVEGNLLWDKTLGGDSIDRAYSIDFTQDGGSIIGGASNSDISGNKSEHSDGYDYWIVKLDEDGNIEWDKTYGDAKSEINVQSIKALEDGYIFAGQSNSHISGSEFDIRVIRLNSIGNITWDRVYGGDKKEEGNGSVQINIDYNGGFVFATDSYSDVISGNKTVDNKGSDETNWIVKIDDDGEIIWDMVVSSTRHDEFASIIPTKDKGYLVSSVASFGIGADKTDEGNGENDFWLVKLEPEFKPTNELSIYAHCFGDSVHFEAEVLNPFTKDIYWFFGDGNMDSSLNTSHIYNDPGNYLAGLVTEPFCGAPDTQFFSVNYTSGSEIFEDSLDCIKDSIPDIEDSTDNDVSSMFYLFIPNAFSPNNDGKNDHFFIHHKGISSAYLSIYDRMGKMVFETNNLDITWTGKYKRDHLSSNSYTYSLMYTNDLDNNNYLVSGMVLILPD